MCVQGLRPRERHREALGRCSPTPAGPSQPHGECRGFPQAAHPASPSPVELGFPLSLAARKEEVLPWVLKAEPGSVCQDAGTAGGSLCAGRATAGNLEITAVTPEGQHSSLEAGVLKYGLKTPGGDFHALQVLDRTGASYCGREYPARPHVPDGWVCFHSQSPPFGSAQPFPGSRQRFVCAPTLTLETLLPKSLGLLTQFQQQTVIQEMEAGWDFRPPVSAVDSGAKPCAGASSHLSLILFTSTAIY